MTAKEETTEAILSTLRITEFHFVKRDSGDVFGVIEREGKLDIMEMPTVDKLHSPIDHLKIVGLSRIAGPLVWPLKVQPGRDPPQKRFHSLLIPFHIPKPSLNKDDSRVNAMGHLWGISAHPLLFRVKNAWFSRILRENDAFEAETLTFQAFKQNTQRPVILDNGLADLAFRVGKR